MSSGGSTPTSASRVTLSDGRHLEVLKLEAASGECAGRPPLVFVHGSFHAAWCWEEHWLPWFAARGWDVAAVSLASQGESDVAPAPRTLRGNADDVWDAVTELFPGRSPVLVGHSFGGLVVQRMLCDDTETSARRLAGAAVLCSVPPYGNSPMVSRFMKARPLWALKLTWAFVAKGAVKDPGLCRETFFGKGLGDAAVAKHMAQMAGSSKKPLIDLGTLNRDELPLPPCREPVAPVFVGGARGDNVVDVQGVEDTAAHYGVAPVLFGEGMGHDVMLDAGWEVAAEALERWLLQL